MFAGDGTALAEVTLAGRGRADLAAVDALARVLLAAARTGGRVVVTWLAADLGALVTLAGLEVEMAGKAKGGEEMLGVEEEGQLGDGTP